ncbi:MAG: hypothetical protein QOH95_1576, partial [Gaiellaceae bacterium]|nr:hypothetical protein [Gaiellaceae bacterium]
MHEQATDGVTRTETSSPSTSTLLRSAGGTAVAPAFSIARREGAWRDALLRRMLAVADLLAGLAASASIAFAGTGQLNAALWSALLAPV